MKNQTMFKGAAYAHRIAIQVSAQGRFLTCLDCHLHFEFPSGTPYLTIASQFESQSCGSAPSKDDAPGNPVEPCRPGLP